MLEGTLELQFASQTRSECARSRLLLDSVQTKLLMMVGGVRMCDQLHHRLQASSM